VNTNTKNIEKHRIIYFLTKNALLKFNLLKLWPC